MLQGFIFRVAEVISYPELAIPGLTLLALCTCMHFYFFVGWAILTLVIVWCIC